MSTEQSKLDKIYSELIHKWHNSTIFCYHPCLLLPHEVISHEYILTKERERRAQQRKNEKSAVVIQAAWRSLLCRRRTTLNFKKDLSNILSSGCVGNHHQKAVSLFLICSRFLSDDGIVTTLVNHLSTQQEASGFRFLEHGKYGMPWLRHTWLV